MRARSSAACRRACEGVLAASSLLAASFVFRAAAPAQEPAPAPSHAQLPDAGAPISTPPRRDTEAAEPGPSTMTLHVYAAHVQVPALVLTSSMQPVQALDTTRFRIRLDSGPSFPPSSVRLEGEDPISMAVVFDAAGSEDELLEQLTPALVRLRTGALRARDSLYLFAVDCREVRFLTPLPFSEEGVTHAVRTVLGTPELHSESTQAGCRRSLHLWDAVAGAIKVLAPTEGRRVVLALTTGDDRGSRNTWAAVSSYGSAHSVTVFAVTGRKASYNQAAKESPLWSLCALTGGLPFPPLRASELVEQMNVFVSLLRHRYILEFPRSNKLSAGRHSVDVGVEHTSALVRVTGVSVPMLDDKARQDPATVPYLEADRLEVGSRRPIVPGAAPK